MKKRSGKNRAAMTGRMSPSAWLAGRCILSVGAEHTLTLMNMLLASGLVYEQAPDGFESDGDQPPRRLTRIVLSHRNGKRLREALGKRGIVSELESVAGLPHIFGVYRRRLGLWAGLAAAVFLLVYGSGVVWQVRVTGNEEMTERGVLELLRGYGVHPGASLKELLGRVDEIRSLVEMDSPEIAWMSLNLSGTVAYVQIREEKTPPDSSVSHPDGANLVADTDGVVTGFALSRGKPVVAVGDTVRRGDLLVTGIIDSERLGVRIVCAEGEVRALTTRSVSVTVPFVYEQILPVSREILEVSLIFFGSGQKLFKNYGNEEALCDTIYSVWYIYSSKEKTVPVGLSFLTRIDSVTVEATRTPEEATALGELELNRLVAATAGDAEILRRRVTVTEDENGVTLTCEFDTVGNIARQVPFYVD